MGVPVGTGEPAEQVATGVARKVETADPQLVALQVQFESRLGQELSVMDQAVQPTMPVVVTAQPEEPTMLVSKVESSALQLVSGPYSPMKTG